MPPKTVPCPTCRADVRVPRDAQPGDEVVCPECDEAFVPRHLRQKAYDPTAEEGYGVRSAADATERKEKRRKAKAAMTAGREYDRDLRKSAPRPFFGGFELVLVVVAAVVTAVLLVAYAVARRLPNTAEGAVIVAAYCGAAVAIAVKILRAKSRFGG